MSLVGPSGCGKSTLLRLIAGLDTDYSGQIELGGRRILGPHPGVGVVFQEPRLMPWLSVRQNIAFAIGRSAECLLRADALAEQMGLGHALHELPKNLSGGMAQRCAIARALITKPQVLLMDEPFTALDAFTRMHLQDLTLSVWEAFRTTIVLVTHDIDEALYLSDRVVVMRPGGVKAEIAVELPRPRERKSAAIVSLERSVLTHFDLRVPAATEIETLRALGSP